MDAQRRREVALVGLWIIRTVCAVGALLLIFAAAVSLMLAGGT